MIYFPSSTEGQTICEALGRSVHSHGKTLDYLIIITHPLKKLKLREMLLIIHPKELLTTCVVIISNIFKFLTDVNKMTSPIKMRPVQGGNKGNISSDSPGTVYAEPNQEVIYASPGQANVYDSPEHGNVYATPNQSPIHSSKPGSPAMEWDGYQSRMSQGTEGSERWDRTPPEIPHFDLDSEDRNNSDDERDEHRGGCCLSCRVICRRCLTKYNPLPDNPTMCARLKHSLLCPPHGRVSRDLTLVLFVVLSWGVVWGMTGDEALPGGSFFALYVVMICCVIGGSLIKLAHMPPLLGMS